MSHLKPKHGVRILVVEDNQDIAENIADYLEARGHTLDFAMDGIGGLHLALTQDFDAIVLDIMLPGMDGLTFCRKLRTEGGKQTPVLMLTARDTLDDKLEGFDAGADDYLVKPFALEELDARLSALVRRAEGTLPQLCVADLVFDVRKMKVVRAGTEIKLNRVCLKILQILMQASPNIVKRGDLEHALWGDMPPGSDALRSHIYALRHAVDKPFKTPLVQTVHGLGYRLVDSNEISS
ncbi:MAG: response regulator transcription factor [Desulfobacterales bacterium]|nr:response regulator transcription factor [Desulfobacterales bacterium]